IAGDAYVVEPPAFVIGSLSFKKATREIQPQRVACVRKVKAEVVDAVAVESVTKGVHRCRPALLRAVGDWIVLLAQIGAGLRIVGESGIKKRRAALNAQSPPVRTVRLIVAIPALQNVEVERNGHKGVRLEIAKGQRDSRVNPNKVL